jgi:hypothetical protein
MSCEAEINPKWAFAIDSNICPFCGKGIMEDQLKQWFVELRSTMDSLTTNYPNQLNDWLLSNYNLAEVKTHVKSPNASGKFIVKVKNKENEEEEVVAEKIQDDETANEFFKRAHVKMDKFNSLTEKTEYLKQMALQIKKSGGTNLVENADENLDEEISSAEVDENEIMSEVVSDSNILSSLIPQSDSESDLSPSVLAMMKRLDKSNKNTKSSPLEEIEQLTSRVQNSYKNFESGGGGFSRSS